MMGWILVSSGGLFTTLMLIFYYIINNKLEQVGLSSREFAEVKSTALSNRAELYNLRKRVTYNDLCLERHRRVDENLEDIKIIVKDIQTKVDKGGD